MSRQGIDHAGGHRMQAVVIPSPGQLALDERAVSDPEPGWARVRVQVSGLCATDLALLDGQAGAMYPLVPGHEWTGVVEAVGSEADQGWVGQRVVGENDVCCLVCEACRTGHWRWCAQYQQIGFGRYAGSDAHYLWVPVYGLQAISSQVSDTQAALLEPLAVALGVLARGRLTVGETVTIIGDGPIGLNVLAVARLMGARRVMVVGEQPARLKLAEQWGAYRALDRHRDSVPAAVQAAHGRSDLVVEATGTAPGFSQALALVRPEGRVVLAGFAHGHPATIVPDAIHLPDVQVIGAGNNPGWLATAVKLVEDGMIRTEDLVTHRWPLDDYQAAFQQLRQRTDQLIKSVFDMTS